MPAAMTRGTVVQPQRPNVIFIIMDDLCYGDLNCHGNPYTKTPSLNRMHAESARLTRYCTGPLCSPARACVMTGRYQQRTRVIDTYCGRAMIDSSEITIAHLFRDAGYRTGCFGKWHLGDCHPMRPDDLGFEQTLVHKAGVIGQPGDHFDNYYREARGEEAYFDPYLYRNGEPVKCRGYCTDIFADATIRFIEQHRDEPFSVYLATNAPHSPLEVADEWADPFRAMGVNETHSRLYGMVENIDMNVGRILDKLDELGLRENTLVVYTSDHGPCVSARNREAPEGRQDRFNAGLRGTKGTVYEGGIRVPSFWQLPGRMPAGLDIDRVAHAIDIMPALIDACGLRQPEASLDGVSLLPLLTGETLPGAWPDRTLYMQWHRGDVPMRYRNYAAITQRYKLTRPSREGFVPPGDYESYGDELYDLGNDPFEASDLASEMPELVESMRSAYDAWFDEVSSTRGVRNYDPPLIHVGSPHENPTVLTEQDWRLYWGAEGWRRDDLRGRWGVWVAQEGEYEITLRFRWGIPSGVAHFRVNDRQWSTRLEKGHLHCTLPSAIRLGGGQAEVEAWLETDDLVPTALHQRFISAKYAEIRRCRSGVSEP